MNAQELLKADGSYSRVFMCSKCGLLNRDKEFVDRCCICRHCGEAIEDRKREYTGYHSRCWHEHAAKRERERLDKAELVENYLGPLYFIEGFGRDGFVFNEVEEVLSESIESVEDWPEFALCCKPTEFPRFDVDEIVERCADQLYEDAYDDITIPESLVKALREFREANKDLKAWSTDWTRKVRVPPIPEDLALELDDD